MSATVALGHPTAKLSSSISTRLHPSGVATRIVGMLNMKVLYTPVRPNLRACRNTKVIVYLSRSKHTHNLMRTKGQFDMVPTCAQMDMALAALLINGESVDPFIFLSMEIIFQELATVRERRGKKTHLKRAVVE